MGQTKPWMSLLPVLIMVPVQFGVSQITKLFRNKKMYGDDGKADELEELWDDEVKEAENDVAALAFSFMTIQSLRYFITGHLPNIEGEDSEKVLHDEINLVHVLVLYGIGLLCMVIFGLIVKYSLGKKE